MWTRGRLRFSPRDKKNADIDRPVIGFVPGKLVGVKVREIIRMVEKDEWTLVRQKGSHRQYHHALKAGTVTIAGHPSMDLDPKTERSILKQAGLNQ
jgi:predicted RNA binding protein YcfA (HicA-like mRNA interferase family)